MGPLASSPDRGRVAHHDHRQRDQHLQIQLLHTVHGAVARVARDQAQYHAAQDFHREQFADVHEAGFAAMDGDADDDGKDDHADAVVEQRLPSQRHLQRGRHRDGSEQGQHRDGIGRTDQGAENQCPDEGDRVSRPAGQQPCAGADEKRGDQRARGRHQRDCAKPFAQGGQIYVQGAREQQETQHAVHQCVVKVDPRQHMDNQRVDVRSGHQGLDEQHRQRGGERDEDQPDGVRRAQIVVIDVAEQGRQPDEKSADFKQGHSIFSGANRSTRNRQ